MSPGRVKLFAGLGVVAFIAVCAALLVSGRVGSGPSASGTGPSGWLAARTYLERRGLTVLLADRPPAPNAAGPGLVITFPWQTPLQSGEADQLRFRVSRGGQLVFAYSGLRAEASEQLAARALGLTLEKVGDDPPLDPFAWLRFQKAESVLRREAEGEADAGASARPVVVGALRTVPVSPSSAQVLYRLPSGQPAIFTVPLARGRLLVLPADALSNGRLGQEGNGDLLESLVAVSPEGFVFDEYHHGLAAPPDLAESSRGVALDALLLHLALLYALCVFALARRFGPAWREAPAQASSTAGFLEGLGELHRRLGHADAAAILLLRRAEEWNPRIVIPESLRAAAQAGGLTLLELARAISRRQISRRTSRDD